MAVNLREDFQTCKYKIKIKTLKTKSKNTSSLHASRLYNVFHAQLNSLLTKTKMLKIEGVLVLILFDN